jgi:hypothetical protein
MGAVASQCEGGKGKRSGGVWTRPPGSASVPRARSGPVPWPGLHARARAAVVRWRGQEIELGWQKEERERMTHGVHRS